MHILFHVFFFFNDTATTEIYTLSLHDALPISACLYTNGTPPSLPKASIGTKSASATLSVSIALPVVMPGRRVESRSEEHTSELQSHLNLVCRLLLEKKKITIS